jgi:WD40 repeat protein
MSTKSLLLFVILLAGCKAVPDTDIATVIPTRTSAPANEATIITPTPSPSPTAEPLTETIPQPTPTTEASVPAISFGQPFDLGRGVIQDAAFLPGGEQVAVGWANGVSLFNVADGAEQWHHSLGVPVIAVTVHPQGTAVAAGLGDGSILVVDAMSGQAQRFDGARPYAYIGDVVWSPDGRTIAFQFIGPRRGDPIYLLNVADGAITEVPGTTLNEGTRPYLVWSPDSQTLSLASLNEVCGRIVQVATGETFLPLAHEEGCYDSYTVAWSPDGNTVALSTLSEVHLLDITTRTISQRLADSPLNFGPTQTGDPLAFSADGRTLCSKGGFSPYSDFFPFRVWDVATGELVGQQGEDEVVIELEGENPHRMAVICERDTITSLYRDGRLTTWTPSPETNEVAEQTMSHLPVIAPWYDFVWSGDGRKIAILNRYGGMAVWDVPSATLAATFEIGGGQPALSADGRLIALLDWENGEIAIYDLETQQPLSRLPEATHLPEGAFSPDGSWLAYGSEQRVMLADPLTGVVTAVLEGHPTDSIIYRVIWSPDGSALVTAGGKGEPGELILWEWDGDNYRETTRSQTARAGYDCCTPLALFNPSGSLVALETLPRLEVGQFKIAIYDRETDSIKRWFAEYELAAWVSDDRLLTAEAGLHTLLVQWNVDSSEKTVGQAYNIGGHVYSPNGLFFARQSHSGSSIGREIDIHFWQSSQLLVRLTHGYDLLKINWSPDGRYLASLAANGTIRVWPVTFP